MFGRRSPATHQEQVEGRKCTVNVNQLAFTWLCAVLYSLLALLSKYKRAEYLQSSLLRHLRCQQCHLNEDVAQFAQFYIYFVLTKWGVCFSNERKLLRGLFSMPSCHWFGLPASYIRMLPSSVDKSSLFFCMELSDARSGRLSAEVITPEVGTSCQHFLCLRVCVCYILTIVSCCVFVTLGSNRDEQGSKLCKSTILISHGGETVWAPPPFFLFLEKSA